MPTISYFYGISIRMFYNDHAPPHFHAVYEESELVVTLDPISAYAGSVPVRVRSMVFEWAAQHQRELMENWRRCRGGEDLAAVPPLE